MSLSEIMEYIIELLQKDGAVKYAKHSSNGKIAHIELSDGTVFSISIAVIPEYANRM